VVNPYSDARVPRRGGGRTLRRVLVALLVLVLLLVVVDRAGDWFAEDRAATTMRDSQRLSEEPDVHIGGFPFLTQLASRNFDRIEIDAKHVPISSDPVVLALSTLDVTLDHVTFPRDFSSLTAESAHAVGRIGYADLGRSLGADLAYAGDGRVRARKTITLFGRTVTPTVTASPVLVGGVLSFGKAQVDGAGALGGQVSAVLEQVLDVKIPLNGIPFDVRVQQLAMDSSGLRLDMAGADLTYRKG
jgi:hypothetical protein